MNTLQDENNGWLQQNARALTISAALLLGFSAVMWYLPRAAAADRANSWQSFDTFKQELAQVETDDDLNAALLAVEGDERVYPWALAQSVSWAANLQKGESTLALLESKFQALGNNPTGLRVLDGGESKAIAESVSTRLAGLKELANLEATPVEPTGGKVRFTLSDGAASTYELVFQLYEEQAPQACAWLYERIDSGAFADIKLVPGPSSGFQIEELGDSEGEDALIVEKAFGCFHLTGTLCTMLENGGDPGQQSRTKLQLLGAELYPQDGVTTVLGKIVEGENLLEEINNLERKEDDPRAFAADWTLTVERVTS